MNKIQIKSLTLLSFSLVLAGCRTNKHVHTYDTEHWTYDETEHWHQATCGHDVRIDIAPHEDKNNDYRCDICDAQIKQNKDFTNLTF